MRRFIFRKATAAQSAGGFQSSLPGAELARRRLRHPRHFPANWIAQQTILNVLARAGSKAGRFLDATVRNVQPESVQADELFCFVGCKERTNTSHDPFRGDQYLFLAMDAKSKLIISHIIGKRYAPNALCAHPA
jgi:hypothetical protein